MPNDSLAEPHSAAAIWSGYVYQGKVAVYHVLKLLCEEPDCNYDLQLDSLEDFAIKNEDVFVSLHQVKALRIGLFSIYGDSFKKLREKASSYSCCAFFHRAHEITDKTVPEIENEFPPIKVYKYYDNNYECAPDQIDLKIENQIKQYVQRHLHPDEHGWRTTSEHLREVRVFLCEVIQEKVLSIHAQSQRTDESIATVAAGEKINFSAFVERLRLDLRDQNNMNKYYLYRIRQDLRRYFAEYMQDMNDSSAQRKMLGYIDVIQKLEDQDIIRFIINIMPHRKFKFDRLQDYHDNSPTHDGVRYAFYKMFEELKNTGYDREKSCFIWKTNENKHFYPTTIAHDRTLCPEICRDIIRNAVGADVSLMFEKDYLITSGISIGSVLSGVPDIIDVNGETISKEDKRIISWKKVALVSLENAKEDINV